MKNLVQLASLQATENRITKLAQNQKSQATRLVSFGGFDPVRGKAFGTTLNGGTVYFDIESNATPAIGQVIEVAIARQSSYGKGDLRPVK